jgi:hypothetical protein
MRVRVQAVSAVSKTLSRLRWHVNRTPVARAIKWARRGMCHGQVAARRDLVRRLPTDARLDERAEALKRMGYVVLTDVLDSTLLDALSRAGEAKLARAEAAGQRQTSTHKAFWTRLLDEDYRDGQLPTDNPFVAFALQPAAIGVLARALGELPQLDTVLLTLSLGEGGTFSYSQLWHRDYDDIHTIKMFTYLTDVRDIADGPFTFLPGPVSDRFGFSLKSHRADGAVLNGLADDVVTAVIAPRMTTFMVETSRCLHMGSRTAPGRSRLLYTATYITIPRLYPEPPGRFRLLGHESELTRALLSPRLAD